MDVGQYPPEYLVAANEAAVNILTTYYTNGWAVRGLQVCKICCFVRGTPYAIGIYTGFSSHMIFRYSMLPALTMGGYNGDQFIEWPEGLLQIMNPYPAPNSVFILDNCQIHHVEGVEELCEER